MSVFEKSTFILRTPRSVILLVMCGLLCGCGTQASSSQSALGTVTPVISRITASPLSGSAASIVNATFRTHPEGGFVEFAVANGDPDPARITQLCVTDPVSGLLVAASDFRLTSPHVSAAGYEFGMIPVLPGVSSDQLELKIEFADGSVVAAACPACDTGPPQAATISEVRFRQAGDGRHASHDAAVIFLEQDSDTHGLQANSAEVKLQGRACPVVNFCNVADRNSHGCSILEVRLDPPVQLGERVLVEVRGADQDWATSRIVKVAAPFFIQPTDYEFPLHVTKVSEENHGVVLTVYNESNKLKPALVIDAIRIDDVDRTAECLESTEPLPPDNQNYLSDLRTLRIPLDVLPPSWSRGDLVKVQIDYHLVESELSRSMNVAASDIDGSFKMTAIHIRNDLELPVGRSGSPVLPGAVCIHNGSLRSEADERHLSARSARVPDDLMTYARFAEGRAANVVRSHAPFCDFLVAAPALTLRSSSANPVSDYFEYFSEVRHAHTPFIHACVSDYKQPMTPDDLRWILLASLGEGSRGLLYPSDVLDRDTNSPAPGDIAVLESCFQHACRLPLRVETKSPGLHCSLLADGPDRLIVVTLNEWCSRQSSVTQDFHAHPREDVVLRVPIPAEWGEQIGASDLGTGRTVDVSRFEQGDAALSLKPFRLGRITILENAATRSGELFTSTGSTVSYIAEEVRVPLAVAPDISPFLPPVNLEVDSGRTLEIPIVNRSSGPVIVQPAQLPEQSEWRIRASPLRLLPGERSTLLAELTAPGGTSREFLQLVLQAETPEEHSVCSVFIEAACGYPAVPHPAQIDLGRFGLADGSAWEDVSVNFHTHGSRIIQVDSSGPEIEAVVSENGTGFRFRCVPGSAGSFTSSAIVHYATPGQDTVRTVEVGFAGTGVEYALPVPGQLTVATDTGVERRTVRLVRSGDTAISQVAMQASDPRIEATLDAPWEQPGDRRVTVSVQPGTYRGEVSVTVPGSDSRAEKQIVSIPVRVIGTAGDIPDVSRQQILSVAADVDRIVNAFRQFDPPDGTPNWLLFHHLLMFGNDQSETDRFRAVYERVARPQHPSAFVVQRGLPKPRGDGFRFNREHHRDQFLSYLSMVGLPLDAVFEVESEEFTMDEMLTRLKREARPAGELCWTATALANLLPEGERWQSKFGEEMSLAGFYEHMLENPNPTCGGSHELMSFAALLAHQGHRKDPALDAIWPAVQSRVNAALDELRKNQRDDGSFQLPPGWTLNDPRLTGRLHIPNAVGLHYTGHTVEWLSVLLDSSTLREPWVVSAVAYLTQALDSEHPQCRNLVPLDSDDRRMAYGFVAHSVSGIARWRSKVR